MLGSGKGGHIAVYLIESVLKLFSIPKSLKLYGIVSWNFIDGVHVPSINKTTFTALTLTIFGP